MAENKRKFRKKDATAFDADLESHIAIDTSEVDQKTRKRKKKKKKSSTGSVKLSFGEEEFDDGDHVFKLKKSKASKAMKKETKEKKRDRRDKERGPSAYHSSTAGEYTAEKLQMLRANQPKTLGLSSANKKEEIGRVVLKGIVKPVSGHPAEQSKSLRSEREKGSLPPVPSGWRAGEVGAESPAPAVDQEGSNHDEMDQDTIERLKIQRRRGGTAANEEFIPFNEKLSEEHQQQKGVSHDDDDDEYQQWEMEQALRGGNIGSGATPSDMEAVEDGSSWAGRTADELEDTTTGHDPSDFLNSVLNPGVRASFPSVEEVQRQLSQALEQVEEGGGKKGRQLSTVKMELSQTQLELEETELELKNVGAQFERFQAVRAFMAPLTGCLREKEPMVAEVEKALLNLEATQYQRIIGRRQQAVEDQLLDFQAAGNLISLGDYEPTDNFKSSVSQRSTGQGGVDELGRDRTFYISRDRERRAEGRKRRRDQAMARIERDMATPPRSGGGSDYTEAEVQARDDALLSGAEESDSEIETKTTRHTKLMEASEVILDDVDEEYKSLANIKKLFEEWKRDFPEQYANVYCSLSIPQLLQPLVRLEMLSWNPLSNALLHDDREMEDFETFKWYQVFQDYAAGIPTPANAPESEADPDENLVPKLVEVSVFPRVIELIKEAYDPLSSTKTTKLLAVISELLMYDPSTDKIKELFQAILLQMKHTIQDLCIPLLHLSDPLAIHFTRKQLFIALKLYKNIGLFEKYLSPQALASFAITELIGKKAVPVMSHMLDQMKWPKRSEGQGPSDVHQEILRLCEELASSTPDQWRNPELIDYWDLLHDLLAKLAQSFLSHCKNKVSECNRQFTKRMIEVHISFGEMDGAKHLSKFAGFRLHA